jgi:hypothetical protein
MLLLVSQKGRTKPKGKYTFFSINLNVASKTNHKKHKNLWILLNIRSLNSKVNNWIKHRIWKIKYFEVKTLSPFKYNFTLTLKLFYFGCSLIDWRIYFCAWCLVLSLLLLLSGIAQGVPDNATINDLLCLPTWVLIIRYSHTRVLWQQSAQAPSIQEG